MCNIYLYFSRSVYVTDGINIFSKGLFMKRVSDACICQIIATTHNSQVDVFLDFLLDLDETCRPLWPVSPTRLFSQDALAFLLRLVPLR